MSQWRQPGQFKPDVSEQEIRLPQPGLRLPSRQQFQPPQQIQGQPQRVIQSLQPQSQQFQWQRHRLPQSPQQQEHLHQLQLWQQSHMLQQKKHYPGQPVAPPKKPGLLRKKVEVPLWAILAFIVLFIVALPTVANGNVLVRSITRNSPSANGSNGLIDSNTGISSPTSISSSTSRATQTTSLMPGSKPTVVSTTMPTIASTPTVQSQVGDTLTSGNVACTFISMSPLKGDGFTMPQAGDEFIVVRVQIANHDSAAYVYSPISFEVLSGSGNYTYEEYGPATYTGNMRLEAGKLPTGQQVEGDVIFEVPIGDHKAALLWFPNFVTKVNAKSWLLGL